MSVEWSYAQLSKMASSVGGPEKLLKIVKSRAFQEGLKKGRIQMIPFAAGGLVIGILGTVGINKWNEFRKLKVTDRDIPEDEALAAEEILIQKIQDAKGGETEQSDEDATDGPEEG